jgi:hypothetical protein
MLQMSDLRIFGSIAFALLAIAFIAWTVLKRMGLDPLGLLNDREWLIASKLVGIGLLGLVLYEAVISFGFPAASFIYGRF